MSLETSRALVARLLEAGAGLDSGAGLDPGAVATLARALDEAGMPWPAAACRRLHMALDERAGAALGEALTELHARASASGSVDALGRADVSAPLPPLRLVSLGARIVRDGAALRARVFLASSSEVLVFEERWPARADGPRDPSQHQVWRGLPLGALARGQLVAEGAHREPGRRVRLLRASTSVTPQSGAWDTLPVSRARVRDLVMPTPRWLGHPAGSFAALPVTSVRGLGFARGSQTLHAEVLDADGDALAIALPHRGETPGAVDVLARALRERPRWIAGPLEARAGRPTLIPTAVVTDRVHAIDLDPAPRADLPVVIPAARPLVPAIERAIDALDGLALEGLARAEPSAALPPRVDALEEAGLSRCADALARVSDPETWITASIRLRLARHLA